MSIQANYNKAKSVTTTALAICLVLIFSVGMAQNVALIDSLRKQYATASPEKKFTVLTTIGFEYRYSFPDSTIIFCKKAYALGRTIHLQKDLSKPLSFIGLAAANKGDFKQSVKYHYEAIDVAIQQNDSVQLAFGYNNLGRMFFDEGDLVRAYANLSRSKELFELLRNKSGLAYVYRSLANIYKSQHDFAQALEMSKRAYELRRQVDEPRSTVSALVELGLVYEDVNNSDSALQKFRMADSVVAKVHDEVTQAEVKMGMAEILFHSRKYEEAFNTANIVMGVVTRLTNKKLFLRASLLRANYFYQTKNFAMAIPVLNRIVDESENNLSSKRDACFLLSSIYDKQGAAHKAAAYASEYKILDQKLQNSNLAVEVNQLQFKLGLEKIEKENAVLKLNQTRDKALISTQQIENIMLLITVVLSVVILFLLWLDSRRRKKIQRQLEVKNQQIIQQGEEIETKNKDLSQRNHELSDLNNEKDTLMNIVAHDLKAPINHILGISKLFETDGQLTSQQREYLKLIEAATHNGLDLIVDLLDVNALQVDKEKLKFTAFDWGALVRDAVSTFETIARDKAISLVLHSMPNVSVISEKGYLRRILDNLISNAIKFSERDSMVTVTAEVVETSVRFAVKDQGPGFKEEDKEFLFQRFKKLSARPTAGESSNGLGLAIVKTLIDRLGGEIDMKTSVAGTEFVVTIPVRVPEKSPL